LKKLQLGKRHGIPYPAVPEMDVILLTEVAAGDILREG
jgi:hypothetical protein